MAYVAISQKLTHDVNCKINKMQAAELKSVGGDDFELNGALECLAQQVWKEHLFLRDQMPPGWKGTLDNAQVYIEGEKYKGARLGVAFKPAISIPPNFRSWDAKLKLSEDLPELVPLLDHYDKVKDCNDRWEKVETQVMGFLKKCKSLNEAVKLWPQIEMYIPEELIKKVNEKKERDRTKDNAAAEMLKEMDTDHLTSAAVIARMSGVEK